ncbi:hypothetical protein [Streptomyces mutabilis]|uniref:hypothetical protein n=1 Tax=Streptomyces mutabilis TaxID=67332 RepID=UPI00099DE01A|nr:hypothetical protein [Streptomyces mutabilis]
MTEDEIRHPALDGARWPVIGVRVHPEDAGPRAASWRPAPRAVLQEVLLPCTWPELERLAEIATGRSRARVYVRDLGEAGPEQLLVLCLLPEADDMLAAALRAQGEPGVRALGLLQDAARVLSGAGGLERAAEVAESCLRGAADALLSLPGAPVTVGLKPAAAALLDAVDALEPAAGAGPDGLVSAGRTADAGPTPARAPRATGAALAPGPHAGGGTAEPADEPAGGPSADAVQRVREAAEVLRGQLKRPGGFHRARAAGIAVRLMGVELGGAQEQALNVWG